MNLNRQLLFLALLTWCVTATSAEYNAGTLDKTSAGVINISLRINENIRAGLLRNQRNQSDLKALISSGLVQGLSSDNTTTLSLCVESSGGGTFEITSVEWPDEQDAFTSFGEPVSLNIGFGKNGENAMKMRASEQGCTKDTIVPVTIHLNETTGNEVGRINGKLRLLVKSE